MTDSWYDPREIKRAVRSHGAQIPKGITPKVTDGGSIVKKVQGTYRQMLLHPDEVEFLMDEDGNPVPESRKTNQDDDKTEVEAELSAEGTE